MTEKLVKKIAELEKEISALKEENAKLEEGLEDWRITGQEP